MLDTSDQIGPLLSDPAAVPIEQLDPSLSELFLHQKHHAVFKRLRAEDPVHLTPDSPFGPFWSITKFDHIMQVDTDHRRFSSEPIITIGDHREDFVTPMFISMDPPQHDEQRAHRAGGGGAGAADGA